MEKRDVKTGGAEMAMEWKRGGGGYGTSSAFQNTSL
jgi:hypothetical protein